MASTGEEECHSDPNFAVICSFLDRYGEILGLPEVSFTDLAKYLEDSKTVSELLIELHIRLMRRIGKTSVKAEKWEKSIIKFCHYFSQVDAWEIERFGYKHSCLKTKLKLLKNLLECQFDYNVKFKEKINDFTAEAMRFLPVGRDKNGLAYWYLMDKEYNIYVYREEQDDVDSETWQLVCKDRDELATLISSLQKEINMEPADKAETSSESKTSAEGSPEAPDGKGGESKPAVDPTEDSKPELPEKSTKNGKAAKSRKAESPAVKDEASQDPKVAPEAKSPVVKMEKLNMAQFTAESKPDAKKKVADETVTIKTEPIEECVATDKPCEEKRKTPSPKSVVAAEKETKSRSASPPAKSSAEDDDCKTATTDGPPVTEDAKTAEKDDGGKGEETKMNEIDKANEKEMEKTKETEKEKGTKEEVEKEKEKGKEEVKEKEMDKKGEEEEDTKKGEKENAEPVASNKSSSKEKSPQPVPSETTKTESEAVTDSGSHGMEGGKTGEDSSSDSKNKQGETTEEESTVSETKGDKSDSASKDQAKVDENSLHPTEGSSSKIDESKPKPKESSFSANQSETPEEAGKEEIDNEQRNKEKSTVQSPKPTDGSDSTQTFAEPSADAQPKKAAKSPAQSVPEQKSTDGVTSSEGKAITTEEPTGRDKSAPSVTCDALEAVPTESAPSADAKCESQKAAEAGGSSSGSVENKPELNSEAKGENDARTSETEDPSPPDKGCAKSEKSKSSPVLEEEKKEATAECSDSQNAVKRDLCSGEGKDSGGDEIKEQTSSEKSLPKEEVNKQVEVENNACHDKEGPSQAESADVVQKESPVTEPIGECKESAASGTEEKEKHSSSSAGVEQTPAPPAEDAANAKPPSSFEDNDKSKVNSTQPEKSNSRTANGEISVNEEEEENRKGEATSKEVEKEGDGKGANNAEKVDDSPDNEKDINQHHEDGKQTTEEKESEEKTLNEVDSKPKTEVETNDVDMEEEKPTHAEAPLHMEVNDKDAEANSCRKTTPRSRKRTPALPSPVLNLRRSSRSTHQPIRFKAEPEAVPSRKKLWGSVSTPGGTPNGLSDKEDGEGDESSMTGDGSMGKASTPTGKGKATKRTAEQTDQPLDSLEKQPNSKKPKRGNKQTPVVRKRANASRMQEESSSGSDSEDIPLNKVSRQRPSGKGKVSRAKPKGKMKKAQADDGSSMSENNAPTPRGKKKRAKSASEEDSDDLPLKKSSTKLKAAKEVKESSEEEMEETGRRRSARVRSNRSKRRAPSPDSFTSETTPSEMSFLTEEEDSDDEDFMPKGRNAQRQAARSKIVQEKARPIPEDDTPCCRCLKPDHPEWILLCDQCDSGFHTACLRPPLLIIPDGDWFCPPCEHKRLVEKLVENLGVLDGAMKKRERLIKRKERLAFVGISLDNILLEKKGRDGESEDQPARARPKSFKDLDSLPEEVFTRRSCRSRRSISYQFKEFDDLIDNAIHDGAEEPEESEENLGYVSPPRAGDKDIQMIIKAEREAEQGGKEGKQVAWMGGGKDIETIIKAEREAERLAGKDVKEEKEEEEETEEDEDGKPLPVSRKKNRRRLTALDDDDFEENPDDDNEEYRASEDSDSEATIEEENFSEESEEEWRPSRSRHGSHPARRSTRTRSRRRFYNDDFEVNEDGSDDSLAYRRPTRTTRAAAKRRAIYRESPSEEEEEEDSEETEVTENTSDLCSDSDTDKKKKKKLTIRKSKGEESEEQSSEPEVIRPSKGRNTKRTRQQSSSESESESSRERPKRKGSSAQVQRKKKMVLSDSAESSSSQSESEETEEEVPKKVKKRRILDDSTEESAEEKPDEKPMEEEEEDKEEKPSEDSKKEDVVVEEAKGSDKEDADAAKKSEDSAPSETTKPKPEEAKEGEGAVKPASMNGPEKLEEGQTKPQHPDLQQQQQPPVNDQNRGYHPQGNVYPQPEGHFSPKHPYSYPQQPYYGPPPMYSPQSYRPEHFGGPYQPQMPYNSPPYSQAMGPAPMPHHGHRPQMSPGHHPAQMSPSHRPAQMSSPSHRSAQMSPSHRPSQMTSEGHSPHLSPTHHPQHIPPSSMHPMVHPPYPGGHMRMFGPHPPHYPMPPHPSSQGMPPPPDTPVSFSGGSQVPPTPPPQSHMGQGHMGGGFMIDNLLRQPSAGSFSGEMAMAPAPPYSGEPRPGYPKEQVRDNHGYPHPPHPPQPKGEFPDRPAPPRQPQQYQEEGGGEEDDLSDVTDIVNYVMSDDYFKQNA